jgi:hypothetical protein
MTAQEHADITEARYHADPCERASLSSSIMKILIEKSPVHAWMAHPRLNPDHEPVQKTAFDLGSVAHKLLLGAGATIQVIDAPDWRTKAAKAERDAGRESGRVPILRHQYDDALTMAECALAQINGSEIAEQFGGGVSERVIAWEESGAHHRAMIDRMSKGRALVFDYKTTARSAAPGDFIRTAINLGYDIQVAQYRAAVKAAHGIAPCFIWIVQEMEPPYAVSLIQCPPALLQVGEMKRQRAIQIWNHCMETGVWPGYPAMVVEPDVPAYYADAWQRRADSEDLIRETTGRDPVELGEWSDEFGQYE